MAIVYRQPFNRPAFSLIELLVTLGVLMIVIGLLAPALGNARRDALKAERMQQLRSIGGLVALYAMDYRGLLPTEIHRYSTQNSMLYYRPLIAAGYVTSITQIDAHESPMTLLRNRTAFALSACAWLDPALMSRRHWRPIEEMTLAPQRLDAVWFPAGKGLAYQWFVDWTHPASHASRSGPLWFGQPPARDPSSFQRTLMLSADGAVHIGTFLDFNVGPIVIRDGIGYPVWSTWDGFRGRDR